MQADETIPEIPADVRRLVEEHRAYYEVSPHYIVLRLDTLASMGTVHVTVHARRHESAHALRNSMPLAGSRPHLIGSRPDVRSRSGARRSNVRGGPRHSKCS